MGDMTGIYVILLGAVLFFAATIRTVRRAIRASNRELEARRQQLAHEMKAAAATGTPQPAAGRTALKKGARKHAAGTPQLGIESRESAEQTTANSSEPEPFEEFDLRKAVIMSEILRPKFDE